MRPEPAIRRQTGYLRKEPAVQSLKLEQLENRYLLNADFAKGILTIDGTDQADHISVERSQANHGRIVAIVNGEIQGKYNSANVRGIRINAMAGDDFVRIQSKSGRISIPTTVSGGQGNDRIYGGFGPDLLIGGPGADRIAGSGGQDVLKGLGSDDRLSGQGGRDSVIGGSGNDELKGGGGADELRGGPDNDTLAGGRGPDVLLAGSGSDRLDGDEGDDKLRGSSGDDYLRGGEGNDNANGGKDEDWIYGGIGSDSLYGSSGNDYIVGNGSIGVAARTSDADMLHGGLGSDILHGGREDSKVSGRASERLGQVSDCDDLARHFDRQISDDYQWYFRSFSGSGVFVEAAEADVSRLTAASDGFVSQTNTQEQGVDESDLVETDGKFAYIVRGNQLVIARVHPARQGEVVSRVDLEGGVDGIYLNQDRLTVVSRVYQNLPIDLPGIPEGFEPSHSVNGWWGWWGSSGVKLTVFDVSDASAPEVVHETYVEGSAIDTRRIGNQVYLVANWYNLPRPWYLTSERGTFVETPEHFKERLQDIKSFLPQYVSRDHTDDGVVEESGSLIEGCGEIYTTPDNDWSSITVVTSLNMAADAGIVDSTALFGYVNDVYSSTENLYVVRESWHGDSHSAIHKVSLGDDLEVVASGDVPGTVLNQFSLDEHSQQGTDYLRVATTSGGWTNRSSNVYVMTQEGTRLNVVGAIEGIAPGETIQSARFEGDHGFLVTFERIDPLFTIDLTDPTEPQIAGELEITGFSGYLQLVDENTVLGIGRAGDEDGRIRGVQVSLFDVSDFANPSLVDKHVIDTSGWVWSEAQWDHHAVGFFADSGTLTLPISGSKLIEPDSSGKTSRRAYERFSELLVFQVDAQQGLEPIGSIEHESNVRRAFAIDEVLYAVSNDLLSAHKIDDPNSILQEIPLTEGGQPVDPSSGGGATLVDALLIEPPPDYGPIKHFSSCGELAEHFVELARNRKTDYYYPRWSPVFLDGGPVRAEAAFAAPDASSTNVQVSGVDEADIVETDGNFIFHSRWGQNRRAEVVITDVRDPDNLQVVSRIELDGSVVGLYLSEGRLTIVRNVYNADPIIPVDAPDGFKISQPTSLVGTSIYDVGDPHAPVLVQETLIEGRYRESRRIGNQLYLVHNSSTYPSPWRLQTERGTYVETIDHFEERLADIHGWLPHYTTREFSDDAVVERSGQIVDDCTSVHDTSDGNWWNMTSITAIDLVSGGPVDSETILGSVSDIYASHENIYATQQRWSSEPSANIIQFSLGDEVDFEASGSVPGRIDDQFSMDEFEGNLRVTTTGGNWRNPENNLFVLTQDGEDLEIIGSIEGLAPGERIQSTRFDGDTAYVVTFERIDPLFVIDLSIPESPTLKGELEMPGFSGYLQRFGADHLIGLGRDADPETGRIRGLQVSLFDTSDDENPELVERFVVNTKGWTHSEAEWDHHAVALFEAHGVLAIPVTQYQDGAQHTLLVLEIDPLNGITELGQVEHTNRVRRAVRIGELVFSISETTLKANDLFDPARLIDEVVYDEDQPKGEPAP